MEIAYAVKNITPQQAKALLENNVGNRPMKKSLVEYYASEMSAGRWNFNGDSIRISSDGIILDGQHRLQAIALSGIAQNYVIVNGLPPEVFNTIDRGKGRTVGDSFAVAGEKNSSLLAAAVRVVAMLEDKTITRNGTHLSAVRAIEILEAHPDLRYWANKFGTTALKSKFDSSIYSCATLFGEKYGKEKIEVLMNQLSNGESLSKTDPAYVLRERAIANKTSFSKIPKVAMVAIQIKGFKAFVEDRQVIRLTFSPSSELFPYI